MGCEGTVMKAMLKAAAVLSCAVGLAFALTATAQAAENSFSYEIVNGKAVITGYEGNATDLTTPTALGGYPVTSIGERAFYACPSLKSLTISEGVQGALKMNFTYCDNLETIRFPSTFTSIYGCAFTACPKLTNIEVDSRNPVYSSRNGDMYSGSTMCFYANGKPQTEFTVPSDVKSIWVAFANTTNLKTLNIGDNVQSLGNPGALEGNSIEAINIGKGLTQINEWIEGGSSLRVVNVDPGNPVLCSKDGILYSKDMGTLLTCPARYDGGHPVIDARTNKVQRNAFKQTRGMKVVTFQGRVTSMCSSVFFYCNSNGGTSPLYVRFDKGVDASGIDENAFWYSNVALVGDGSVQELASRANKPFMPSFDLSQASVSKIENGEYGTESAKPHPVVTLGTMTLVEGRDYELEYAHADAPGTATVTMRGIGEFTGSKSSAYRIVGAPVAPEGGNGNGAQDGLESQVMHRMYNPNSGEHFYTADGGERDALVSVGWDYEGVAWNAPKSGQPVYRMYNENAGDHHYTPSAEERDMLVSVGWNYEGVGWYSDTGQGMPLYRLYNPNALAGSHHYTTSAGERDMLKGVGWQDEGIGWYGCKQ